LRSRVLRSRVLRNRGIQCGGSFLILLAAVVSAPAQQATMRAHVQLTRNGHALANASKAVLWLTPVGATVETPRQDPSRIPQLVQKHKSFQPPLLVIPVGGKVEFPNRDPFFHNVFSLFEGKRFDLGLYEAGTTRMVHFDRPGISYIFCNIHPEMSGVVITLTTPFYAVANGSGQLQIMNVPYGRYWLHVWSEGTGPEAVQPQAREITIAESSTALGMIRVAALNGQNLAHKNKYGRDYDAPTPDSPIYHQQP